MRTRYNHLHRVVDGTQLNNSTPFWVSTNALLSPLNTPPMPRKTPTLRKAKKEPKPYIIALRVSARTFDDLVIAAHRQGVRRGTLAAQLLDKALRTSK